mgnify:CR=1 FL=1
MKSEQLVFLLGAGASVEAKIPASNDMVDDVEKFIISKQNWKQYFDLYNYIKSSIIYSKGIQGQFNYRFNIEDLLIVLEALEQRDKSIMYPYIGNWNMRLVEVAGENFENIGGFKSLIKEQISEWVKPKEGYDKASYYQNFISLQNEIGETLKIFTLNYDLCFERTIERNEGSLNLEMGFSDRKWSYKHFDSIDSETHGTHFALYKLHGSVNWKRIDESITIEDDPVRDAELIFGTPYKLTSTDPYFFYSTEFRKSLLSQKAKLIITIGYSFYDDYLNKFITQAMKEDSSMKLIVATFTPSDKNESIRKEKVVNVAKNLSIDQNRIIIFHEGAKHFMQNILSVEVLEKYLPTADGPFADD